MIISTHCYRLIVYLFCTVFLSHTAAYAEDTMSRDDLDSQVRAFLENRSGTWRDLNIPASDGKVLYDIIVENGYTKALEIGTSTGHSAIWIAWALSKTGGRLTTIDIDESRHRQALENFREAGVSAYIDARLADAHELVKELDGPFDFVFSDADKGWYKNYFIDIDPKLEPGGCFTAHNVSGRGMAGITEFLDYVLDNPGYKTEIDTSSRSGISISYKKKSE